MATARFVATANNSVTKQLLDAVATVNLGVAKLARVKAEQDMMVNGEAVTGTQAALEYGLPDAASGAAVCNIVGTALTALQAASVQALSKIDQG